MKYIFIGMLLNSLVTSSHDNEEACKGREVMLREKGVVGQCLKAFTSGLFYDSSCNIIYLDGRKAC